MPTWDVGKGTTKESYEAGRTGDHRTRDTGAGDAPHLRRQTVFTPPKVESKGDGWINKGISYLKDKQKKSILKSADRNRVLALRKMGLMKGWNPFSDEEDWSKNMSDADLRTMASDIQGIKDYGKATYNYNLNPSKKGSGSEILGRVSELKSDPTQATYNRLFPGPEPGTGGGGEGGQTPWWLNQPAPVASTDTTTPSTDLGSGHFQVPLEYVVGGARAADGGLIGSVGGTSRQKYQEGAQVDPRMNLPQEENIRRNQIQRQMNERSRTRGGSNLNQLGGLELRNRFIPTTSGGPNWGSGEIPDAQFSGYGVKPRAYNLNNPNLTPSDAQIYASYRNQGLSPSQIKAMAYADTRQSGYGDIAPRPNLMAGDRYDPLSLHKHFTTPEDKFANYHEGLRRLMIQNPGDAFGPRWNPEATYDAGNYKSGKGIYELPPDEEILAAQPKSWQ